MHNVIKHINSKDEETLATSLGVKSEHAAAVGGFSFDQQLASLESKMERIAVGVEESRQSIKQLTQVVVNSDAPNLSRAEMPSALLEQDPSQGVALSSRTPERLVSLEDLRKLLKTDG